MTQNKQNDRVIESGEHDAELNNKDIRVSLDFFLQSTEVSLRERIKTLRVVIDKKEQLMSEYSKLYEDTMKDIEVAKKALVILEQMHQRLTQGDVGVKALVATPSSAPAEVVKGGPSPDAAKKFTPRVSPAALASLYNRTNTESQRRVVSEIHHSPEGKLTIAEIRQRGFSNRNYPQVAGMVNNMLYRGLLVRVAKGTYTLPPSVMATRKGEGESSAPEGKGFSKLFYPRYNLLKGIRKDGPIVMHLLHKRYSTKRATLKNTRKHVDALVHQGLVRYVNRATVEAVIPKDAHEEDEYTLTAKAAWDKITYKQLVVLNALKEEDHTDQGVYITDLLKSRFPGKSYSCVCRRLQALKKKGFVTWVSPGRYRAVYAGETYDAPETEPKDKVHWKVAADNIVKSESPKGGWESTAILQRLLLQGYDGVRIELLWKHLSKRYTQGLLTKPERGRYLWKGKVEVPADKNKTVAEGKSKEDPPLPEEFSYPSGWHQLVPAIMTQQANTEAMTVHQVANDIRKRGISVTDNAVGKRITALYIGGKLTWVRRGTYLWAGDKELSTFPLPPYVKKGKGSARPKRRVSEKGKAAISQSRKARSDYSTAWTDIADKLLRTHALTSDQNSTWSVKHLQEKLKINGYNLSYQRILDYILRRMAAGQVERVKPGRYRYIATGTTLPEEDVTVDTAPVKAINNMKAEDVIIKVLQDNPHHQMTAHQIVLRAQQLGFQNIDYKNVNWHLTRMAATSVVIKPMEGWYQFNTPVKTSLGEALRKANVTVIPTDG